MERKYAPFIKTTKYLLKISGLNMIDHQWSIESFRPFVTHTLQTFGVNKCMFASNFPVDKLNGSFDEIMGTYKKIAIEYGLNEEELKKVFQDNAIRIYKL